MSKKALIQAPKRRFCCCFTVSDSDSDNSSINLPRVESDISPSVLEPAIYSCKKFAADKIYFIGSGSHKFLVTFRHLSIDSSDPLKHSKEAPPGVAEELWQDRFKLFSRFDEGVSMTSAAWRTEIPEKIAKNLVKLLMSRVNLRKCAVGMSGVGSLAIQFGKNCEVDAFEEDEEALICLQKNIELYEVNKTVHVNKVSINEFSNSENLDLVVLTPKVLVEHSVQIKISAHIPEWHSMLVHSLCLSSNIAILLPATIDPYDLIANLEALEIDPFIELVLLFDNSHLKFIACLIGKLTKFLMPDIVNSLLSRIGMSGKQREFMQSTIEKISLKRTLTIMEEVEREARVGSVLEVMKSKSKRFIERLKNEEGILLEDVMVLFKGNQGEDVARVMEEMNLFFVEIEGEEEESELEVGRSRFKGFEEIMGYLNELRIKETPNKNSLFQLIGS